jgi:hypothetical protein
LAIGERCHAKKGAWDAVKAVEEINATTDPELAAQLLSDIRDAFNRHNKHLPVKDHRLPTKELLHDLHSDEEGPWLSFGKGGKPITDRQLARLMKEFRRGKGIQSRNIRLVVGHTEMQVKGYERADFEEDFSAYLDAPHSSRAAETPFPSAPPSQTSIFNDLEQKTSVPETPAGTDKNEVNQLKTNNCNVGTDKNVDLAATEEKASVDVADPCASSMATFGRCAQCHGLAADAPLATGDGYPVGGVYLHRECRKFWLAHHRVGLERLGSAPVADR